MSGFKISVCIQTLVCLFTFSVCLFTFSVCLFTFSMFIYILGLFIYIFQCLFTFSVYLFTFSNVYLHFSMFIYKNLRNFLKFKAGNWNFDLFTNFGLFIYIFQCLFIFSIRLFTFSNVYLHFSMFIYKNFRNFLKFKAGNWNFDLFTNFGLFIYIFQCLFTFSVCLFTFSVFIYKNFRNFLKFKAWELKFRFVYKLWFVYLNY